MKDLKLHSSVLAKEVNIDGVEKVAVFELVKFQGEDLSIKS